MHMHVWHHSEPYQPEKAFRSDRGNRNPRVQLQFKRRWRGVSALSLDGFNAALTIDQKPAHLLK